MDQKKFISVSVLLILLLVSSVLAFEKIENPFEEKDKYHKSDTGEYSKAMNILEGLGLDGNKQGLKDFQSSHADEIDSYRKDIGSSQTKVAYDGKLGYGTIKALNNQWGIKTQAEEKKQREQEREQELIKQKREHERVKEGPDNGGGDNGIGGGFKYFFSLILKIGSLEFLLGGDADNQFCGFIRIALMILIFTILYMALGAVNNATGGNTIPRTIAITIAIIMAIISSIFIPCSVMMVFGGTYAVLFSLLIIGGPIAGIGWMVFGTPTPNRGIATLKLFGILLLWWLISEISHWAGKLI